LENQLISMIIIAEFSDQIHMIIIFLLCRKLLSLENPFEFIWNLKSSFEIWKFDLNLLKFYPVRKFISNTDPLEWYLPGLYTVQVWRFFYFKYGSFRVVHTMTVQGSSLKIFRWDYFLFRFILNFQISKLDLRFQINSNGFSRHRDSGHKSKYILKEQKLFTFWTMSGGAKYLFSSHCLINNQLIRFISK
jgi:hypothetical protein